jgi:hypothetical protein
LRLLNQPQQFRAMGSSGSVIQSELQCELDKPLDASDVITPRGESLKAEVIHMRQLLHQITNGGQLADHLRSKDSMNLNTELSSNQLDVNLISELSEDEHTKKHKDPHRILGVDDEEMKRTPAMRKLGITDQDYQEAADILIHSGVVIGQCASTEGRSRRNSKTENILGYTQEQQHRSKAVRQILGTSESSIEAERAEELGRVGKGHQLE